MIACDFSCPECPFFVDIYENKTKLSNFFMPPYTISIMNIYFFSFKHFMYLLIHLLMLIFIIFFSSR